jgi:hypothetical protein
MTQLQRSSRLAFPPNEYHVKTIIKTRF